MYCWGANNHGQLGNGTTTPTRTPTRVASDIAFQSISAGNKFSTLVQNQYVCGLATDGAAYCWGSGRGPTPAPVDPQNTWTAFVAVTSYPCGITAAGETHCWYHLDTLTGFTFAALFAGRGTHCGLTAAGAGYCWGDNVAGQLGAGQEWRTWTHTPQPITGGHTFRTLSVGDDRACGIADDGTFWCWGTNLGSTPVPFAAGFTFLSIAVGRFFSCAVGTDSVAYCWGNGGGYIQYGQLGDGTRTGRATPAPVMAPARK